MSKSRSRLVSCLSFGAFALGVVGLPGSAEACSLGRIGIQSSFPRDGAVGVPPSAPVVVYGPDLGSHGYIFRDAEGNSVPFEGLPAAGGGLRFLPFQGLEPNTTYEFGLRHDDDGFEDIVTFTTGETRRGPHPLPVPPEVEVRLIDTSLDNDMCGPRTGICLRGDAPEGSTLEVWVGDDVIAVPSGSGDPVFRAYATPVRSDECIEVRVRSQAGDLSEPTTFCEDDLPRFDSASVSGDWSCARAFTLTPTPWHGNAAGLQGASDPATETDETVLTSADVDEPAPRVVEGGCALRPNTAATTSASGLLLGLAALLVARQRRRTS